VRWALDQPGWGPGGDQIGRIFYFINYKSSPDFWTVFCQKFFVLLFEKWVGLHFGRFLLKLVGSPS
jgi:hypothetical protein